VPTVFIGGADPVQDGVVKSLAKPGGNITGFSNLEPSVGAKLLSLLREIAPDVKRAAVMFNPDNSGTARLTQSAIDAAKSFGVEAVSVPIRGPQDVERAMSVQAAETHTGFIVPPDPLINFQRKLIVELAGRRRLPAIHALRSATAEGGLISYGVDIPDLFRKSAAYVDRILRGEKPGDLPVQQPTKFELVINLKTARELGLNVPQALMVAADEIIQ
jgi:putative ABC transport system substrate-binding protein